MGVVASLLWVYGGIGLAVAAAFLLIGFDRSGPAAEGAYAVRPLLFPSLILLWPLVIWRWRAIARESAP